MSDRHLPQRDLKMAAAGISEENGNVVKCARALIMALAKPNVVFTIESLAEHTGMERYQVDRLLSTPEMADLLRDETRALCSSMLRRNLTHLQRIMESGEATPTFHLRLQKALLESSEKLQKIDPRQDKLDEDAKQQAFWEHLDTLRRIKDRKKIDVTIGAPNEQKPEDHR